MTNSKARTWRLLAHLALLLLIVLLPLPRHWPLIQQSYPHVNNELTSLSFYLADAAVLMLFLTAIPFVRWRDRSAFHPKVLLYPLVLLLLLTAVSALAAFDIVLALQQALRLAILLALVLVLIYLRPKPRVVQLGLIVSVVLQTAVAFLQFIRQNDLGLRWLGEIDINPYPGGGSIITVGDQYWLRGYGLTPHPNILGGILVLAILTLLVPLLQSRPRQRPVWFAVLLAAMAGLFISFSRSAWLGGVVGGTFFMAGLLLYRPWRQAYGRTLLVLVLAGGLLLGGLAWSQGDLLLARSNPNSSVREARSLNERGALNSAALALAGLAPLTGIGAGNSAVATIPLVSDLPGVAPQPAHNMPLLLAAELGIPGSALWLWLMFVPVALAFTQLRRRQLTLWALGLTAALLAFAVIDLFDYYAWGWAQGRLLRWLYWGLWAVAITRD